MGSNMGVFCSPKFDLYSAAAIALLYVSRYIGLRYNGTR